ncbi:DNA repair protein RadC [Gracilibacillus boraciitolerans JCM 21714]|uniref:DNA repair protein RadC n=1 Tax=Gracilibacillus boraciitolerans JCM 21714 TaxID=1298598 RepID=W4VM34_9BACI|nr:DNA repair protein RadC [Gracilibacillus boraciitolerans]GAE93888.1 DNA repair protein RadC [Gracilibacillus boraciitolerans JCM 21714]
MNNIFDKVTFKLLLASTIREKEDGYVVNEIFTRYPSIQELLDVTEEELLQIDGIGKVKAKQILSALKLARMNPCPVENRFTVRSPEDAYNYLNEMKYLSQEHFVVLGLNTKNEIIFKETVFIGSLNASIVHPRETFKHLIRRSCASAIVAHNHPSGQPDPSREDIEVTKRLSEAGKILGIDVLDHIIVGAQSYVSLKEKGYI